MAWAEAIDLFITKFCETKNDAIELIFDNRALIKIYTEFLQFSTKKGNQKPESIISNSGISNIDNPLNELKKKMFSTLKTLIFHTLHKKIPIQKYKNSVLIGTVRAFIPFIINSIILSMSDQILENRVKFYSNF